MTEQKEETTLEDLRKQIPKYMWEAYERYFDDLSKEDPEQWPEKDKTSYMAEVVKSYIAGEALMRTLLRTADEHGIDLEEFMEAIFGDQSATFDGVFSEVTVPLPTLGMNPTRSNMFCTRLIDELNKHDGTASVRRDGLLPKSFISTVAVEMLRMYSAATKPPPVYLVELICRLLDTTNYGVREYRLPHQQEMAAFLLARDDTLSNRALSKAVGVSTSTISRWKNDQEFNDYVYKIRSDPEALRRTEKILHEELI